MDARQDLDRMMAELARKPDTVEVMAERQGLAALREIAPILDKLYEGDELPDVAAFQMLFPTE